MVGYVRREVHGETNSHDQHNHADHVQVYPGQRHEPNHTNLYRDDGEGHPDHTDLVRDEKEGNDRHTDAAGDDTADGGWEDEAELIKVLEVRMEDGYVEWCRVHNCPNSCQ